MPQSETYPLLAAFISSWEMGCVVSGDVLIWAEEGIKRKHA